MFLKIPLAEAYHVGGNVVALAPLRASIFPPEASVPDQSRCRSLLQCVDLLLALGYGQSLATLAG